MTKTETEQTVTHHAARSVFQAQQRWHLLNEPLNNNPANALLRDTLLLKEVASGARQATVRIWENPQCLVVTRKETRFPCFAQAKQQLEQQGWPVIVRDSGGTAVPHHPGILNLSLILPQLHSPKFDLDSIYLALCEPIIQALKFFGLKAEYGETPGSYCDGRFNLNIEGLKITGTAQRMMLATGNQDLISHGILAQAMLMVEADAAADTEIVNQFYRLAGMDRQFAPDVATSLNQLDIPNHSDTTLTQLIRTKLIDSCASLCKSNAGRPET